MLKDIHKKISTLLSVVFGNNEPNVTTFSRHAFYRIALPKKSSKIKTPSGIIKCSEVIAHATRFKNYKLKLGK